MYTFDWSQSLPFRTGGVDYAVHYNSSIKIWSVISQGGPPRPVCINTALQAVCPQPFPEAQNPLHWRRECLQLSLQTLSHGSLPAGASLVLFFAALYATWWGTAWLLSQLGRHRSTAALALALWFAASLLAASRPVSHAAVQPDRQHASSFAGAPATNGRADGVQHDRLADVLSRSRMAKQRGVSNDLASADISPSV